MSFINPPISVPFPRTLSGIPTKICNAPPEGPRAVRVAINFSIDTQAAYLSTSVNLQNISNATNPISQISCVKIDNSKNTHQCNLYFPDTQDYVQVPALSQGYYPVQTNGLQCTVWNSGLSTNDTVTIFFMNTVVQNYSISENTQSQVYLLGSNGVQYQEVSGDIIQSGSGGATKSTPYQPYLCGSSASLNVNCTIKSIEVSVENFYGTNNVLSFSLTVSNAGVVIQRLFDTALGVTQNTPSFILYSNQNLQYPVNAGKVQLGVVISGPGTLFYGPYIATSIYYTVCYTTR